MCETIEGMEQKRKKETFIDVNEGQPTNWFFG
jgi:hypothetical protein